jgi:tetratricopeptide (TPR) repeat protein
MSTPAVPVEAREALERSSGFIAERRFVDAIPDTLRATELAPEWNDAWWNLGVVLKHALRWEACAAACEKAIATSEEHPEGALWNLGIAATALGDWRRARGAWERLSIKIPAGEGPLTMPLGLTPVRVAPCTAPEVVWCDRIDPCRAIVRSVPLPGSGRRFGDLVLHDGEPRGRRRVGDRDVAVFDELTLLEASAFQTWELRVRAHRPEDFARLEVALEAAEITFEDWTGGTQLLCTQCSLGEPFAAHEHARPSADWNPDRRVGVAISDVGALAPLRFARWWWRFGIVDARRVF